jgi:MFS family permease
MSPHAAHEPAHPVSLPRALVTTTTIQILSTMTALALTAIAPAVAHDLGVAPHYVGYQISLIYLAAAIASAAAGTLVDRHGAVRIEQVALATFALGMLGIASGVLAVAALASLVIGVGYGLQNPASSQILGAVTPRHRRGIVFSIKQAGVPIGGVLASLMFPRLVPHMDWRLALALAALPSVAMIAVLAHDHRGEPHVPAARRSFVAGFLAEQRLVWGNAVLRVLSLLGMLYSSVQLSLSAFTVTMLVAQGWSLVAAGGAAGLVQLCGAVGRVSWGMIADRWHAGLAVLAAIGFVTAACMAAMYVLPGLPVAVQLLVLAVFGFCISGWNGVMIAEATHHCAPADTGRVIGGSLVYTFLGVVIGPSAFATLYGAVGSYGVAFLLMSVVALAGATMVLLVPRRAA